MEIIETIRVTKKFGRTLENLEMLWFLRDQAERRFWDHVRGESVSGEVWAAVNTPDEAFETPASATYTPPPAEWKTLKDEWEKEAAFLLELKKVAHRNVRIATGHEPIGKLVCR